MDYLQYFYFKDITNEFNYESFKPYYKWITFNTFEIMSGQDVNLQEF